MSEEQNKTSIYDFLKGQGMLTSSNKQQEDVVNVPLKPETVKEIFEKTDASKQDFVDKYVEQRLEAAKEEAKYIQAIKNFYSEDSTSDSEGLDEDVTSVETPHEEEEKEDKVVEPPHEEDMVNNPSHYKQNGTETIDMMEINFGTRALAIYCLLNTYKYRERASFKGNREQDIKKAEWYKNKYEGCIEKIRRREDIKPPSDLISY